MRDNIIGTDKFVNEYFSAIDYRADIARRDFLKLLGTSLALTSTGCSGPPPEHIVPYAHMPENYLPGEPVYYATVFMCDGYAYGVLAENNDGRPIKIEGNPHHPASLGSSSAFAQASIYQLWDPDRSQVIRHREALSSWNHFRDELKSRAVELMRSGGTGLHILSGPITSPTAIAQLQEIMQRYPRAQLHIHDAMVNSNAIAGTQLAFGRNMDTIYHFDRAATIVSFDHDFLAHGPAHIRYARDFSVRRQPNATMTRLYAFESVPNLTGAMADHRAAIAPADQERLLWRLAQNFDIAIPAKVAQEIAKTAVPSWWGAMCADLNKKRGASLIVAGPTLPVNAHALVHKLNEILGNHQRTVNFIEPVALAASSHAHGIDAQGFDDLVGAMQQGAVNTLLIVDCNAVYTQPNSAFATALQQVPCSIHLGLYRDETATACTWHVPAAHTYEMWSDARAFDGSASIIQPLIAPLYEGKTFHELLAILSDNSDSIAFDARERVRNYWRTQFHANAAKSGAFDNDWNENLKRGSIANTAYPAVRVNAAMPPVELQLQPTTMALVLSPDPCAYDGNFSNNAWLQELPKPLTKLTWDNALVFSPKTADALGITNGDIVELRAENSILHIPAMVQPMHADNTCSLTLGYGRWSAGRIGNGLGVNAYKLFSPATPWLRSDVTLKKTSAHRELAIRQQHDNMEQRELVRVIDLNNFLQQSQSAGPRFSNEDSSAQFSPALPSLYPDSKTQFKTEGYQWGMAIDLNACIGCNACVIACQAENNIPVVGADEVARGHSMHWLRIDRYYDNTSTLWQPVPCMHCENAPCEAVCPVGATVHDSEGLNVQVYNRCIGTRFCSNNCPYKVRRFNFFQYADEHTPAVKARQNPDVTVRQRGVMEKCSYCLQRITRARLEAEKQNRELRDGEVVTACQGACPTRAINFGDTRDKTSAVSRDKQSARHYTLLEELNTRPRTTYLARVINNTNTREDNSAKGIDDAV